MILEILGYTPIKVDAKVEVIYNTGESAIYDYKDTKRLILNESCIMSVQIISNDK